MLTSIQATPSSSRPRTACFPRRLAVIVSLGLLLVAWVPTAAAQQFQDGQTVEIVFDDFPTQDCGTSPEVKTIDTSPGAVEIPTGECFGLSVNVTSDAIVLSGQDNFTSGNSAATLTFKQGSASSAPNISGFESPSYQRTSDVKKNPTVSGFTSTEVSISEWNWQQKNSDPDPDGNPEVSTFTLATSNTAPTASGTISPTSLNDDAGPTALFGGIDVSDPDAGETDLALRVTVGNAAAGVISGVNGTTVTNEGGGVFSVDGSFDPSTIDTALDNLRFNPTDNTGNSGTFNTDLTVQVDDQESGFVDVSGPSTVTVTRINDAPTVTLGATSGSIDENNSPPTVLTSITVSDPDGGTNDLTLSGADTGAFNINGSNELEFTETADFERKSSYDVTVEVNDPNVGSDPDDSESFSLSINDVNDPPTVATNTGSSTDEGTNDTITQGELAATDAEEGPAGLTYTIDTDVSEGQLYNIFTSTQLGNGDTFTQEDLNDGLIEYRHDGTEPASESFDFTVRDGAGGSASGTFTITIDPVNDAPTVATNQTLSLNEGASADLSQGLLEATDPDDAASALTYTIDTDVQNGQIVNTSTSTQLDQGDPFTQANINSGDIEYRHNGSETTADAFDFTVADGNGGSANGTFDVSVSPQNDAPVATADDFTGGSGTDEDTPLSVSTRSDGLLPNDTDTDDNNADLSVAGVEGSSGNVGSTVTLTSGATVTVASNGTFTYDPNGAFENLESGDNAIDSFNYTTEDDGGAVSSSATVTVQVNGVNDEPTIAGDQSLSTSEGAGVTLAGADLDGVDPDDSPSGLTYSVTSAPSSGEIQVGGTEASSFTEADLDNGDVTYVHNDSETASDAFDVELADGGEDGASAATATISVSITLQNDDPTIATNTGSTVDEGTNDLITQSELETTDPEQGPAGLTYTIDTDVTEGDLFNTGPSPATQLDQNDTFTQADLNNNRIEYRHGGNEPTSESFEFTVADGQGGSASATFSITINPVNDAPTVATNQTLSLNEGASADLSQGLLEATDPDDATSDLTYTIDTDVQNGQIVNTATSTQLDQGATFTQANINSSDIEYRHDGSETTADAFDFTVADGNGGSANGTFDVSVSPQNDAPVANADDFTGGSGTDEDTPLTVSTRSDGLLPNDTDEEDNNADLSVAGVEGGSGNTGSTVTLGSGATVRVGSDGTFTYDPNGAFENLKSGDTDTDSFTYTTEDDGGAVSSSATVTVQVNGVNDAPTITTNSGLSLDEGATATIGTGDLSASDADDTAGNLTYTVTSDPAHGTLLVSGSSASSFTQQNLADGVVEYRHDGSETTADDFTFELTDDDGAGPTSRTFSITVNPQNDPPTLSLGSTSGSLAENNSPPTVLTDITINDPDGGSFILSLSGPDAGAFNIKSSGELEFTTTADFETKSSYDVTVEVNDPNVGSDPDDSESFSLSITDVNEPPTVATNSGLSLNEGATTAIGTGTLSASDEDAGDGASALTFSVTSAVSNGTLFIDGSGTGTDDGTLDGESGIGTDSFTQATIDNGNLLYAHDGSETPSDGFTFDLTDDDGAGPTGQTFSITVNLQNDAPVANADDYTGGSGTDEDTPLTISTRAGGVLPNDTDTDDNNADLSVAGVEGSSGNVGSTVTLTSGATVTVASNGTFTYDPNGAFENLESGDTDTDSFTYTTEDDGGAVSSSATVTVQINGLNDAPSIAGDQSLSLNEGAGVTLAGADLDGVDPDDGPSSLTYTVTSTPSNGEVRVAGTQASSFTEADLDNGDVTYVHNDSETASDAFDVELTDGGEDGTTAATATIDVSITLQNDAPTIAGLGDEEIEVGETLGPASFNVSDEETDDGSLTLSGSSNNTTLVPNANITFGGSGASRTIKVTPAGGEEGTATITVTVTDGGGKTASASFNLTFDATPDLSITDGSPNGLDVPARVRPGTDNNPLGAVRLSADRSGASLDGLTVTNSAPDTEGITRARLFWSTDRRLDVGTDTELDRVAINPSDAPQTITFSGFSQSIPTAARYVIVAVDVAPGITAEAVQLTLAQTADLQTPGGEIETVNGTAQTSFSNLALSNGTTRLPLRLSDFGATVVQNGNSTEREQIAVGDRVVRVTWQAADERSNKGFEVQRKQADAPTTAWAKVGFVESTSSGSVRANGAGKSAKATTEYRFDDVVAFTADSLEYRLRQEGTDGSESFYKPATVTSGTVQEVQLLGTFPNPARSRATVRFAVPKGKAADVTLRLYDLLGRQVQTVRRSAEAGRHEIQLDVSRLSSGAYFLRLGADETFKTRKIVVTR